MNENSNGVAKLQKEDSFNPVPFEMRQQFKAKSALMIAIRDHIEKHSLKQSVAAKLAGTTQPRISLLKSGAIEEFSLGGLCKMAESLKIPFELSVKFDNHDSKELGSV